MNRIVRLALAVGVMAPMAGTVGCAGGDDDGDGNGGQIDAASADDGGSGGIDLAGHDGPAGIDAVSWRNVGVCAERGQATVTASSFDGWEERYIISDSGFGADAERPCVVRFALERVGDAPHASGCMDTLSTKCEWTHLVEYASPQILADVDGACSQSELALTSEAIAKLVGTRIEVGFAREYAGAHGSSRMKYFDSMQAWDVAGNAGWDVTTGKLTYTFRDGFCGY